MPIEPGVRIGAYTVQEFVGRGAMGMVYRAYHEGLARPAAVKVLQALAPDAEATARFRREAQSIGQMRHPNVLQVFDFGEFEGTPYMVVEYVAGGGLDDRLVRGAPYDQKAAIALLRGIGAALDYAHSLGIVHRDVKPANVLLGPADTPILADFGLAKLLQSSSLKSMTGVTTGTPAYMAPEQAAGQQVGPAADRYALATVAYQLLTGGVPFQQEGVLELLYAHVHQEPPAASSRNPALPAGVDAVLARGLAKAPEARWGSCAELVDRLEAALSGVGSEATQPLQPVAAAGPVAAAVAARPVAAPAHRRRWPAVAAVLALLLLALLVVAGVMLRPRGATLSVRPGAVRPGEAVTLTADHLPAGQNGTVRFGSRQVEVGTFHADSSGHFQETVRVPGATPAGSYPVKVCWNAVCPASTNLTVG